MIHINAFLFSQPFRHHALISRTHSHLHSLQSPKYFRPFRTRKIPHHKMTASHPLSSSSFHEKNKPDLKHAGTHQPIQFVSADLPNFRCLSQAVPTPLDSAFKGVLPARVYRSSALSRLENPQAIQLLTQNVNSVIDLRTNDELYEDHSKLFHSPAFRHYIVKPGQKLSLLTTESSSTTTSSSLTPNDNTISENNLIWFHSNLVSKFKVLLFVLKRMNLLEMLTALVTFILKGKEAAKAVFYTKLSTLGIKSMYQYLFAQKKQLAATLELFTHKPNLPTVIFCSAGKDRTGVVSALLLASLGASKDVIVDNFATSELYLRQNKQVWRSMEDYLMACNLDVNEWMGSPKDAMRQCLTDIESKYGSIDSYLDHIGIDQQKRNSIRKNLTT